MNEPAEPSTCPECTHPVYRPLLAPVRQVQHQSCRTLIPGTQTEHERCGCKNAVHRVPVIRARHRREVVDVAS